MGKIYTLQHLEKSINIVIKFTEACNLNCNYCINGLKNFSKHIKKDKLNEFLTFLGEVFVLYNNKNISITITGGEPTLYKKFFEFLEKLSKISSNLTKINVKTNAIVFLKNEEKLKKISNQINKNIYFTITYHHSYHDLENFILSLKILEDANIEFFLIFLIPEKIKLSNYLKTTDKIINSINIDSTGYKFNLIKDQDGYILKGYSKEILDFFSKSEKKEKEERSLKIKFKNNEKVLSKEEVFRNKLNIFMGYECHYISQQYISLNLISNGRIVFGDCRTLEANEFEISEALKILKKGNKKIICNMKYCSGVKNIYISKTKPINYDKIKFLEKKLYTYLNSISIDYKILNINISIDSMIQIVFEYEGMSLYVCIEKIKGNNYFLQKNGLGYFTYFKNLKNMDIGNIDLNKKETNKINKNIYMISQLNNIYKKILYIKN